MTDAADAATGLDLRLRISVADNAPEGLRFITVTSEALRGRADITVWLPEGFESLEELPLTLLLHGVYGSHWAWALNGRAHQTAGRLIAEGHIRPVGLIMPSDGLWGDGSGYVSHPDRDFERWIVEEVPWAARQLLPKGLRNRTPLSIAGLSMGGFGALRIGAKYGRDLFTGISGHSSITDFAQMKLFTKEPLDRYGAPFEDRSVFDAMPRNRENLPPLRFDCGTEDPLLFDNRELHDRLEWASIPHVYEEFPGGHEWPYWERHVADTLLFFHRTDRSAGRAT
jgi:putative tributyrin esterase